MAQARFHVLIVDDDQMLCRALESRLAWAGFSVASASSGQGAIHKCARRVPDAMILDVALPDIDGFQVCRAVRHELKNDQTAIVFLSGSSQTPRDSASLDGLLKNVGGQFFLKKPYDARSLISLLDSITGNKRLTQDDLLFPLSLN